MTAQQASVWSRWAQWTCLMAIVVVTSGCGAVKQAANQAKQASNQAAMMNDLKQLGLLYHNHHDANRQGPAGWDEAIKFAGESGMDAGAITRVRDAGYQVQWGVKFSELTEGMANTVMAENPAGGPKLMFDASVQ